MAVGTLAEQRNVLCIFQAWETRGRGNMVGARLERYEFRSGTFSVQAQDEVT